MADKQQVRADIREFLTTRRARITPEQAGLRVFGNSRRVSGLRREEVATLAGISAEYYIRLERGNVSGVSEGVLEGVAHALQLNEAERAHLFDLVRTAGTTRAPQRRRPGRTPVRPPVQRILDSMRLTPAFVVDDRLDVLASNELGRALYAPIFDDSVSPPNQARFVFLDRRSVDFWRDWDETADDTVALLRASAGRNPHNRDLSDLIGELATRSEDFRVRWAAHNVRSHNTGLKQIHHPIVGDLDLPFEGYAMPHDPGQYLLIYTAEPNSSASGSLELLASWTTAQPTGRTSDAGTGAGPAVQTDRP